MSALPSEVDVAVIGAGTAGAAVAAFCVEYGLRVLGIDRAPLDRAGATWVNAVPNWCFERARLALPTGDELHGRGTRLHMLAGHGPRRVVVDDRYTLALDMRRLVGRLQGMAKEGGAAMIGRTRALGIDGNELRTDRGTVRSRWFVDASGLTGAHLLGRLPVARHQLCAAAQQVREIADPAGARAYFDRYGVQLGESLSFFGNEGGFSLLQLRCEGDRIDILTGSIPGHGHPSGPIMLERFVRSQPWLGPAVFGGARAIPIRAPLARIARGDVALIGDAACQVFAPHGSGVGIGLVAARRLAEALASGNGPRAYELAVQRDIGALLAGYDPFRQFSQMLSIDELGRLIDCGLVDPAVARFGLEQRFPDASAIPALGSKVAGIAREPRLSARLGGTLARMVALRALYRRYPRHRLAAPLWNRAVESLSADATLPA